MILFFILLTIIMCAALIYCAVMAGKKKMAYSQNIINIEMTLLLIFASNLATYMSSNMQVSYFAYSLHHVAMDWFMLFFLMFIYDYTLDYPIIKKISGVLHVFAAVDMLLSIFNVIFHTSFDLKEVFYAENKSYFVIEIRKWPMVAHDMFIFFLVAMIVLVLVLEASSTSRMYRKSYWIFSTLFFSAAMIDALLYTSEPLFRLSLFLYGALGIVIYYFSIKYSYHDIVNFSLEQLLKKIACGIMLFDIHKRPFYINEKGRELFDIPENDYRKAVQINAECYDNYMKTKETQSVEERIVNGRRQFLEKEYFLLKDDQGYAIGNALMVTDRTEEYEKYDREHYLLTHDSLTGFYTREQFGKRTRQMLDANPNTEFCMVCFNIKDFKLINDLLGTNRGDEVLLMESAMIKQAVSKPGTYGRIGGDKFAVCMPRQRFSQKTFYDIIKKVEGKFSSATYRMHIYMGVYNIKNTEEAVSVMCDRCNLAIQSISNDYSRFVAYYHEDMLESSMEENHLLGEFEQALQEGQFVMFVQPQINHESKLIGAEALVRWNHPKRGQMERERFITLFERYALISKLDKFIWREAAKTLRRWADMGHEELYLSVNISAKDFFYLDIFKEFTNLVEEYDINPKRLKLEITETAFLVDPASRVNLIERLQEYGFEVELDNFGSGYSSLYMLKDIRTDGIKIDQRFFQTAITERRGLKVLKGIFALTRDLDMHIVVKGVEKKEQVEILNEMGDSIYQGYYFSKPIPVREFEFKYKLL